MLDGNDPAKGKALLGRQTIAEDTDSSVDLWSYYSDNDSPFDHISHLAPTSASSPSQSSVHAAQNASGYFVPTRTIPTFQAIPASPNPEHILSWERVCQDAVVVIGPREFVPQAIYQPHSQEDRERYISSAKLQPPIIFKKEHSSEWGIPVQHLLSNKVHRLVGGSEPAFTECGPSIDIRVQWPGYQPCYECVSTRNVRHGHMISKAELAEVVAKCVKQFMDSMSTQAIQAGSDWRWRVGRFAIRVDDIILVSLHHVSQGSWQPQLRLNRSIGTITSQSQSQSQPPSQDQ
ncbi:hypothetical protein V8E55_008317 [Tylopilus felleus]